MSLRLVLDAHASIAESLLWDDRSGLLYWIDIKAPAFYRFDPRTGENRGWTLPHDVGAFALMDGESAALVALRDGLYVLSLASGAVERVAVAPWDPARFRFNEGLCDPGGRFWVGCMFDPQDRGAAKGTGPLQSWSSATGLQEHGNRAACHNGMAWTPDGAEFYLSHSQQHVIHRHRSQQGTLGPAVLFAEAPEDGVPDGAAVDEEGAYWCAIHGGSRLNRYAPGGELLSSVPLPVSQPTMCAFGGPDMRTLFVSSASEGLDPAQQPQAGGLFALDPGVRGLPRPTTAR